MRLPNVESAEIKPTKIVGYLLDLTHSAGRPKARFFLACGFSRDRPDEFRRALLEHPVRNEAALAEPGAFGDRYVVRCRLATPDGRDPCILTVWEMRSGKPWLVTAYPFDAPPSRREA